METMIKFLYKVWLHLWRNLGYYCFFLTLLVFFFAPMWFMLLVAVAWLAFFYLYPKVT